jgi:hypothetical protein
MLNVEQHACFMLEQIFLMHSSIAEFQIHILADIDRLVSNPDFDPGLQKLT